MTINVGDRATAAKINAEIGTSATDRRTGAGTTMSTTYTSTITGGNAAGVAFIAPASGKVLITCQADMFNTVASNNSFVTIQIRTGNVVGSGTLVLTAADDDAAKSMTATPGERFGVSRLHEGLTAGASYNVQQLFRVSSGTGTFNRNSVTVTPG